MHVVLQRHRLPARVCVRVCARTRLAQAAAEDVKRHLEDRATNQATAKRVEHDGQWAGRPVRWPVGVRQRQRPRQRPSLPSAFGLPWLWGMGRVPLGARRPAWLVPSLSVPS